MSKLDKELKLKALLAAGASSLALTFAGPVFAQDETPVEDAADEVVEIIEEEVADDTDTDDTIVVTGSRIKKSTFTSISPLQVITSDAARDVGLIDPSAILQQSEAASGQQIDATFQGFVLDNGPGSQTLNLRGLGADRTLLMINGRRMAPVGVEGAPSNPSINLLPGSLIDRYDLLLDGASSVYGSDAVAGVGNVILRKDFEGFELFVSGDYNEEGAGHDYTVSGAWGKNNDRGFFGIGAEYDVRDEVTYEDRDFLAGCDTHYEVTSDGDIRTIGIADDLVVQDRSPGVSVSRSPCKVSGISGRIFSPFQTYGSIYYTDGPGNSGIPGFNESTVPGFAAALNGGRDIDSDGDGLRDVDFQNVNVNGDDLDTSLISEQQRISVMAYGEYTLDGESNLTPYFEALYATADVAADNGQFQVFPAVPGTNPFNPCRLPANGGVDCAAAENTLLGRPGVNTNFPLPVLPIFSIAGDRENVDLTLEQIRFVGGIKGDMPWLNAGPLKGWSFDISGVYSEGSGDSHRFGIREDKLAFALGWDPSADFDGDGIADNDGDGIADDYQNQEYFGPQVGGPCDVAGLANPGLLLPDVTQGCVAVDLFNSSVLGSGVGNFATQAERDYLFGERSFDTTYTQTLFNAFATGEIFELPAGAVSAVIGGEYRKDEIESNPNVIASQGLFWGFSSDQGAIGEKDVKEGFFELDIPVLADSAFGRELTVNLSGRYTEPEFYDSAWTYSGKIGYRPVDSLLLKASFGTSFRAPNLRENFLAGRTGFNTLLDPCAISDDTFNGGPETRDAVVLSNCIREGRDPLTVGVDTLLGNSIQFASVEIKTGGTLDLKEETSESFTTGFAFEQPWFDTFDLNLNVNYYDIEISDAVVQPSAQFILNDCYARQDGTRSAFCDRIQLDNPASTRGLVNFVESGFINQDKETVTGLDYNLNFNKEFTWFDRPMDFGINLRANQLKERDNIFVDDNGNKLLDKDAGEFGFPEWTATNTTSLDVGDYRFSWQTRMIGEVEQQADGIDELDDAFGNQGTGFFGDTCGGPSIGDVLCRDVGFADNWFEHAVSIRYRGDTMTLRAGITNVLDTAPPLVDSDEVFAISNTPIGNGYDLDGREYFFSISKDFN